MCVLIICLIRYELGIPQPTDVKATQNFLKTAKICEHFRTLKWGLASARNKSMIFNGILTSLKHCLNSSEFPMRTRRGAPPCRQSNMLIALCACRSVMRREIGALNACASVLSQCERKGTRPRRSDYNNRFYFAEANKETISHQGQY